MYLYISYQKQICHIFSYKIFQAFMLQSHWICVTISPNQKLPQRMGQLHRAAGRNSRPGRPHRQRAVACPSKIRRAHRKSLARHCAKSCWCRWVHGARALPWPEDSAKRRIFLLVDKFWYPAKSEEVASSLVPSLLINHCNSSSWLLPSWLVDLSFQSCCAFFVYQQWVIISRDVFVLPQCQGPEGQAGRCAYDPSGCQLQLGRFSIGHVGGTDRWRHQGVLLSVGPVGLGCSGSSSMVWGGEAIGLEHICPNRGEHRNDSIKQRKVNI